jgi:hypothetical protein
LEGISSLLYSNADSLVLFGLFFSCLPQAFSTLVLVASDGNRTLPYGPLPIFLLFCTISFAWFISQAASNADVSFNDAAKLQVNVERSVQTQNGYQKGNRVAISSVPRVNVQAIELICEPVPQLKLGDKLLIDISQSGSVRQSGCSFIQQLGLANLYSRWWLYMLIFACIVVFAKIEKIVFWGNKK